MSQLACDFSYTANCRKEHLSSLEYKHYYSTKHAEHYAKKDVLINSM